MVVMACDDKVLPLQERINTVTDDADLEEMYNTERHLPYVACPRARDQLFGHRSGTSLGISLRLLITLRCKDECMREFFGRADLRNE